MNFKIIIFLFLLLTPFGLFAQHDDCGTDDLSQTELQTIHAALQNSLSQKDRTPADSAVPIKFHVISYSNNTGGIDSIDIFNELASVNTFYANAGIKFVHCGDIDYISNSTYADFEKGTDETICDQNDLPNVLNVYFAPKVFRITNNQTVNLCGYAYSSSITKNRIIMDNDCSTNGSTLAHEIGHYFSLSHTHSTSAGNELANGSNCSTAGDELCDTPADPGLSTLIVSSACNYTGSATDNNNQAYAPNVRNIMSYSRKSCRTEFSAGQFQRMKAYFQSFRFYLSCAPVATTDISSKIDIKVYPNPAYKILNIETAEKVASIKLYDQTGRIVYKKNNMNTTSIQVELGNLSTGIYFYEISNEVQRANGKIYKR